MGRLSERVIAFLLIAFLLVYVGYQLYRYYSSPLQLETAFQYAVTQSISTDGIVIRSETVIEQQVTGVESSTYEDGTRVALGQQVAEFYASGSGDRQRRRMQALENEIAALREAQNPSVSNFSNTESINRDIRNQLGRITQMSGTGRFQSLDETASALVSLLNKKQVALGREQDYEARISQLQAEYDRLQSTASAAGIDVATAPAAGYFVGTVDGLETILTPEILDTYTVEDFRSLIEDTPVSADAAKVGKIVTNVNWYYAALVPKYDIDWLKAGKEVMLNFETVDEPVPGVVENILSENTGEDAVLVIKSKYISGELLSLRHTPAVIQVEQYSGLRVSTPALRFQGDIRGVYVLSRNTVYFKSVNPVYEETGFLISGEGGDMQGEYPPVSLYDQIIVKGKDLHHGKVIE